MNSTLIANQAEKYLGKPYCLDDPSKGWDCFNLLLDFYRTFGYEFPSEFEGYSVKKYKEVWLENQTKAKELLSRFWMSIGRPIGKGFFIRGDRLLFRIPNRNLFAAISLGNGNMKMAVQEGVIDVPFHKFEKLFVGARRLIG